MPVYRINNKILITTPTAHPLFSCEDWEKYQRRLAGEDHVAETADWKGSTKVVDTLVVFLPHPDDISTSP